MHIYICILHVYILLHNFFLKSFYKFKKNMHVFLHLGILIQQNCIKNLRHRQSSNFYCQWLQNSSPYGCAIFLQPFPHQRAITLPAAVQPTIMYRHNLTNWRGMISLRLSPGNELLGHSVYIKKNLIHAITLFSQKAINNFLFHQQISKVPFPLDSCQHYILIDSTLIWKSVRHMVVSHFL